MRNKIQKIHMVGIGGTGMSGIAEVLLNLGYDVSGSDLGRTPVIERLEKLGARIAQGHDGANLGEAHVLVRSSAIADDNPEVLKAREQGIPIIPRAEMLAELMRLKTGIAVAGTHGKTTTTSFLATMFKEAGFDPTVIIGGILNAYGSNAMLGKGEYLIAEADESDGSFLCLQPILNVVTNIDADHLDFYADLEDVQATFVRFMNAIPFYGLNVVCGDDPNIRAILPRIKRPVVTYGLGPDNDLRAEVESCEYGSRFKVLLNGTPWGEIVLAQPGRHNILNALGGIGVAIEAGVPKEAIVKGLSQFGGVGRRFERKGERNQVLVIDDYGHHPTEIKATLRTARECFPDKRLVVAFQPHRFSRTKALFGDFCTCFADADVLLLTEIYPASETPIPGVNGLNLARAIKQVSDLKVLFYEDFGAMSDALPGVVQPGDVLLTIGAGNIWSVGMNYLHKP
ncbi:UDP-N-acetylmuramate--L-alanine ligase [Desulfoplanes formicivorans]|uniref:UDP-N-acetylmuramate--L-alanine ligase n=1 Tax=Desulfoplanes formicivorans TaxID=1592317 RepID=A0A194AER5_9BACT|nr:UDP-N-acetylmuramate--L-alanine ligase [Desulfoplanes formicivorans]GAU07823.1 UDP-N-acetylmuramate--alanine ligase [Desulfoplanes formicivorans]